MTFVDPQANPLRTIATSVASSRRLLGSLRYVPGHRPLGWLQFRLWIVDSILQIAIRILGDLQSCGHSQFLAFVDHFSNSRWSAAEIEALRKCSSRPIVTYCRDGEASSNAEN